LVRHGRLLFGFCPSTRTFVPCFLRTSPRGDSPCIITRPSPPSVRPEDFHLQVTERAQHATKPLARRTLRVRESATYEVVSALSSRNVGSVCINAWHRTKADPFKFHSQASSPALTRNRQRLPSCLLIEDVSESGFLPRAPAFGPRHLRSSLSDQRPRNFDLTNSTCIGPGRHRPGEQIVFRSSS